jgi:radical SAM/Cys-rich protein
MKLLFPIAQLQVLLLLLLPMMQRPSAVVVDAFVPNNNNNPLRSPRWSSSSSYLSSTAKNKKNLPDYGKTSVEIDKIQLDGDVLKKPDTNNNQWRRYDLFGSSIVEQTLEELKTDKEFQNTQERIQTIGLDGMSKEERTQRRRALSKLGIPSFSTFVKEQQTMGDDEDTTTPILRRKLPTVLQINIGLYCNQACGHCHVESSPLRTTEMMTAETAARCLELLKNTPTITTLDITGGAPELNPHFRYLVQTARLLRPDLKIIDRCNLTVLQEPNQEDLVDFLSANKVHIIASLPCYSADNVDKQRGNGVFERSIAALLALNEAGYGTSSSSDLKLDLVYNPLGAFLPPPQDKLEVQYKEQLRQNFGILFNSLYTITNMPIKRFADFLHRRNELQQYMELLVRNFNPDTVKELMCLDTISIGWDGKVSYCCFVCGSPFPFSCLLILPYTLSLSLSPFFIFSSSYSRFMIATSTNSWGTPLVVPVSIAEVKLFSILIP